MTLSFQHYYRSSSSPDAPTFLLLHGTGGDERDLVPLADELWPGSGVLSPRGKVLEGQAPRFFRRLSEGVFDLDDLRLRTTELAGFIREAAVHYKLDAARLIAVGFSNGANIAASLLLLIPGLLHRAVLFRAMVPLVPDPLPSIRQAAVLISNGRLDRLVPAAESERLASLLRAAGAAATLKWQQAGHNLVPQDLADARQWLHEVAAEISMNGEQR